jgi:hypothetical protein
VTSDKSLALLRALSTVKDVHDYALPSTDNDHVTIDQPGFSLKGWIEDRGPDHGLDGQDRWAGGVRFPPPVPALDIVQAMGLEADLDKRAWRSEGKVIVLASQEWGHYDEAKRHDPTNPERGSRIQASPDFLNAMLAKLGRDLIIKVQIDRRRQYRAYESGLEDDKERVPAEARVYLLSADGKLHTL